MKALKFVSLITLFFTLSVAYQSCSIKSSKSNHSNSNILPKERIDEYMDNWVRENRAIFNWKHAPNEVLYSALMQSDSILSICYKLTPDGPSIPPKEERINGVIPDTWKAKRKEIIQYILEKEQKYRKQPNLTTRNILPVYAINNKGACFYIQITDPIIIEELRNDKTIRSLESIYMPASWGGWGGG